MLRELVLEERFSFTCKLIYTVCALWLFSCSSNQEHNSFLPVPGPANSDFEQLCLQKIKETKDPFWYYRLAKVQFEKDHLKSALTNIKLALIDSVNAPEYAKLKAQILLKMEKYDQIDFLRPLSDKPLSLDQASRFAELAIRGKDEALYLKFLSNIDNQSDKYLYLQALHYYYTGEKIKAISYLEKSIKKDPTDDELFKMYLQIISKDGDLIKVNRLLGAYEDTSSLFFEKYYGLNLYALDSVEKSKLYLQKVVAIDTLDYKVNLTLAKIAKDKYAYENAIFYAERSLLQKNTGEAHFIIAYGKSKQKLFHSAKEQLDIAKSLTLPGEKLYDEILKLERNMRYLQARRIERDTTRKVDSIQ